MGFSLLAHSTTINPTNLYRHGWLDGPTLTGPTRPSPNLSVEEGRCPMEGGSALGSKNEGNGFLEGI